MFHQMEVSIVTPTYQRRAFIPALLEIYRNQSFPKEKMEWLILDDGRDSVADLFEEASKTIPNLRYYFQDEKMRIGAKRNWLNQHATAPIIIAMDDDDYYPPSRVQQVVDAFRQNPRINLAGSSEMNLYYMDSRTIYKVGPYGPNHATNGTMAWRKKYSDSHLYNEYVTKAEEVSFLENYKNPMIQLPNTILVICHSDNTVDKSVIREEHRGVHASSMKQTFLRLEDIVKEPFLQAFYT